MVGRNTFGHPGQPCRSAFAIVSSQYCQSPSSGGKHKQNMEVPESSKESTEPSLPPKASLDAAMRSQQSQVSLRMHLSSAGKSQASLHSTIHITPTHCSVGHGTLAFAEALPRIRCSGVFLSAHISCFSKLFIPSRSSFQVLHYRSCEEDYERWIIHTAGFMSGKSKTNRSGSICY